MSYLQIWQLIFRHLKAETKSKGVNSGMHSTCQACVCENEPLLNSREHFPAKVGNIKSGRSEKRNDLTYQIISFFIVS